MANIINDDDAWVADSTTLVSTGDNVDRGPHPFDIYRLFSSLRTQAQAAGGQVITILGNHEMMNALGDWRDVSRADLESSGGLKARRDAISLDGWLGKEWLENWSISAKVALGPWDGAPSLSFTHGSLRPSFQHLTPYPDAMNDIGRSLLRRALAAKVPPFPPNADPGPPEDMTVAERQLLDNRGPLWSRALADGKEDTVCRWAEQIKAATGVRRIIGGHTPRLDRIVHRCNASVIIIDTGISSAFGGVLSALEVVYTLTPTDGHRTDPLTAEQALAGFESGVSYHEKEVVHGIYPTGKRLIATTERTVTI